MTTRFARATVNRCSLRSVDHAGQLAASSRASSRSSRSASGRAASSTAKHSATSRRRMRWLSRRFLVMARLVGARRSAQRRTLVISSNSRARWSTRAASSGLGRAVGHLELEERPDPLPVADDGGQVERLDVLEVAEDRAHRHPGPVGDLVHARLLDARTAAARGWPRPPRPGCARRGPDARRTRRARRPSVVECELGLRGHRSKGRYWHCWCQYIADGGTGYADQPPLNEKNCPAWKRLRPSSSTAVNSASSSIVPSRRSGTWASTLARPSG